MDTSSVRTFEDCCLLCMSMPELVKEYNRLYDANIKVLGRPTVTRTPIEMMVDKACGYTPDEYKPDQKELFGFFSFVYECIWSTLPDEAFEDIGV